MTATHTLLATAADHDGMATAGVAPLSLIVRRWFDPVVDAEGFDLRHDYVERFWLPVLGPSATWLARRLARGLDAHPAGVRVDVADTARALGLGTGTGRNAPISRALMRLCGFGVARQINEGEIHLRVFLGQVEPRHLHRLGAAHEARHERWLADHDRAADADQAMALAAALRSVGRTRTDIAWALNRWSFDPHLSNAAADSACDYAGATP